MAYPHINRGNWFRTKSTGRYNRSCPVSKEYTLAIPNGQYVCTIPAQTYLGPVHEIVSVRDYVTIRVPSYLNHQTLIWVNIRKAKTNFAHHYGIEEVTHWHARGWENIYIDP